MNFVYIVLHSRISKCGQYNMPWGFCALTIVSSVNHALYLHVLKNEALFSFLFLLFRFNLLQCDLEVVIRFELIITAGLSSIQRQLVVFNRLPRLSSETTFVLSDFCDCSDTCLRLSIAYSSIFWAVTRYLMAFRV